MYGGGGTVLSLLSSRRLEKGLRSVCEHQNGTSETGQAEAAAGAPVLALRAMVRALLSRYAMSAPSAIGANAVADGSLILSGFRAQASHSSLYTEACKSTEAVWERQAGLTSVHLGLGCEVSRGRLNRCPLSLLHVLHRHLSL